MGDEYLYATNKIIFRIIFSNNLTLCGTKFFLEAPCYFSSQKGEHSWTFWKTVLLFLCIGYYLKWKKEDDRNLEWWESKKMIKISIVDEAYAVPYFTCLPAQDLLTGVIKWRSCGDGCQMIIISVLLFQPSQVWNILECCSCNWCHFWAMIIAICKYTGISVVLIWALETHTPCSCSFTVYKCPALWEQCFCTRMSLPIAFQNGTSIN